ncbi:unnamed protein product, partial [Prorocentrum cordatum]
MNEMNGTMNTKFEEVKEHIEGIAVRLTNLQNLSSEQDKGGPSQSQPDKLRERIAMLGRMAKELDPDADKGEIERLRQKQAAAHKELQGSKPALTQHTIAGHKLAELEAKQGALVQKLEAHRKAIEEAKEVEKTMQAQVDELKAKVEEARKELVKTMPVRTSTWNVGKLDKSELEKQPEVKAMLESEILK